MYEIDNIENVQNESVLDIQMPFAESIQNEVFLITCDDCLTVADRTILERKSDFFRQKFRSADADDVAIKVDSVNGATLEALLNHCYTGTIYVDSNNFQSIFQASNQLRFTEILDICVDLLLNSMDEINFCDFLRIGESLNLPKMVAMAHAYVLKNFPQIVECGKGFLQLSVKHLSALLRDDNLCVENEMAAFQAMTKWLMYSYADRLPYIPELLQLIRLPQLNVGFLTTNAAFLAKEANCMSLIDDAIEYTYKHPSKRNNRILKFDPRPRYSTVDMNYLYVSSGSGGANIDQFVELYLAGRKKERLNVVM